MHQQEIWNEIADQWSNFRQQKFKPVYDFIQDFKPKKGKILEIGCGNSRNLIPFAKLNFQCQAIDFSPKMILEVKKFSAKNNIKINLKLADMTNLPYKNDYFDYILHIASLHNLEKQEDRLKSLQEAYRVIKPNGLLLLTVWNKLQFKFIFKKKDVLIPWKKKNISYPRFYHLFTYPELKKLIEKTDFKIIKSNVLGKNLVFVLKK